MPLLKCKVLILAICMLFKKAKNIADNVVKAFEMASYIKKRKMDFLSYCQGRHLDFLDHILQTPCHCSWRRRQRRHKLEDKIQSITHPTPLMILIQINPMDDSPEMPTAPEGDFFPPEMGQKKWLTFSLYIMILILFTSHLQPLFTSDTPHM